jgi:hypothetical protein
MRIKTWALMAAMIFFAGFAQAAQRVIVCEETYAEY